MSTKPGQLQIGERVLHATVDYEVFGVGQAGAGWTFLGDLMFGLGSTALALAYAAVIVVLSDRERWRRILMPLAHVGRLALTVYLTQTIMFSLLFYGFAFGQVFRLGPLAVTGYAVAFFSLQVLMCSWWVRRFRYGPFEWLWRSLTYLRVQPIRLSVGDRADRRL